MLGRRGADRGVGRAAPAHELVQRAVALALDAPRQSGWTTAHALLALPREEERNTWSVHYLASLHRVCVRLTPFAANALLFFLSGVRLVSSKLQMFPVGSQG